MRNRFWTPIKTHWYGPVVATLGSLVFFWASLFSDEIRGAFPFYLGPYGGPEVHAVTFWLGLMVVIILLTLRNASDDHARKELVDATNRVTTLVQTLPPKGWREEYAATAADAYDAVSLVLPRTLTSDADIEDVTDVIGGLLNAITTLAYRYDFQPRMRSGPALYAANIMLFIPAAPTEPTFANDIQGAVRFLPAEYNLSHLAGVLQLIPELTYSTTASGQDNDVPPIVLPVPKTLKTVAGLWKVLPGAPLAFVEGGVDGYADSTTIGTWFDTSADFPRAVRDEVVAFFAGPGVQARSFVSRCLMRHDQKLGVLNIHSNLPDVLGVRDGGEAAVSTGRREEFFALMTPFVRELEVAVKKYMELSSAAA